MRVVGWEGRAQQEGLRRRQEAESKGAKGWGRGQGVVGEKEREAKHPCLTVMGHPSTAPKMQAPQATHAPTLERPTLERPILDGENPQP